MRAQLNTHDLKGLSSVDALLSLAGRRPDAVWAAKGVDTRPTKMLRVARTFEDEIQFAEPEEGSEIADDDGSIGLSLRRHPLAIIRPKLTEWDIKTSEDLRTRAKDRQKVRASGIVTRIF